MSVVLPASLTVRDPRINLLDLDRAGLEDFFVGMGEKRFRAHQVMKWIYHRLIDDFAQMSDLGRGLREALEQAACVHPPGIRLAQQSTDGTNKWLLGIDGTQGVETVYIPEPTRGTLCVSSQVGCSLTCKFCATGYMDRERNLDAAEIYDQVVAIKTQAEQAYGAPLSNIVYMGMGEPLLNYANVLESVERITSPDGLGMSPKRITVSTAGIAKQIKKLGDDGVKFNLALSLHAADDAKRNQIMPINESNTLAALKTIGPTGCGQPTTATMPCTEAAIRPMAASQSDKNAGRSSRSSGG